MYNKLIEQETSFVFDGGTPLDENGLCFVLRLLHFHIHVSDPNPDVHRVFDYMFKWI